jgi:glycosyltransferase involved in cell wall biosynthesis
MASSMSFKLKMQRSSTDVMPSILHVGSISGVPQVLSRAQRKLGCRSDVMTFQPHLFNYEVDIYAPTRLPFPLRYAERIRSFMRVVRNYDVLHFHWSSLVPFGFDLALWRCFADKMIMHHHGDDVRGLGESPINVALADSILVSTPDLLRWSPTAAWLPNPIDIDSFPFIGVVDHDGPIKIVHAPSNRASKGTLHVIEAVDALKREGCNVELVLVENMPHQEALLAYRQADIFVDQLKIGWYGVISAEGMAYGKPVCVYIRDDLEESYLPSKPMINANPSTIKDVLRELADDPRRREEMGRRGRRFVEETHDGMKIAARLIELYGR